MADFIQTMKDFRRMCMYYHRANDNLDCSGCPMVSNRLCEFEISDIQDEEFEAAQQTITTWAAEHPEPVYPRWIDWLTDVGLIINTAEHYGFNFTVAADQIPAEIAEKLGIEPNYGFNFTAAAEQMPTDIAEKLEIKPKGET